MLAAAVASALGLSLPTLPLDTNPLPKPRLHADSLERLFGPEQLLVQRNFLAPSLVDALVSDVRSLRATLTPAAAAAAHGSVEWFELLPAAPPQSAACDELGLYGRERLLQARDFNQNPGPGNNPSRVPVPYPNPNPNPDHDPNPNLTPTYP